MPNNWFLVGLGMAGASLAAAQTQADGPYPVKTVEELVLRDSKREKDLAVKIHYPEAKGRFPVIVFSHGAGGSGSHYFPLTHFWTTHGYVVIHPTHADAGRLRAGLRGGPGSGAAAARDVVRSAVTDTQGWQNRPLDVTFVLDSLDELGRRAPELGSRMDTGRVGVGGHSYGAYTAQLIGGAAISLPGEAAPRSFADARAQAILMLSGQGIGQQGLTAKSWEDCIGPMMSVTGSRDTGARGQAAEWRMDPFRLSPPGDKYHVFIEGASHFSFSGRAAEGLVRRALAGTDEKAIFGYVKAVSLAFWSAYLKRDKQARGYLETGAIERDSQGAVKFHRK